MTWCELDLQLLGDQHRHRGVGALAHLDLGNDQRHPAGTIDADEGVGRKAVRIGGRRAADQRRQADAQQQTAAGGERRPAGKIRRERRGIRHGGRSIEPHVQPPCVPVPASAACLIAARMRT